MRLTFRRAVWLSLAAALALSLPTARLGFLLDDDFHRALVAGLPYPHRALDLYGFAPGDPAALRPFIERGPFPWFTLPELKLNFLRPLPSALVYLDVRLFGQEAWAAHLHSIAWYLALIGVAALLYRRLLPENLAGLSLLLFAIADAASTPTAWLANRNSLIAAVFGLLGLYAHLGWREKGVRSGAWLSVLAYALALGSGEAALGALVYVPAYEAFGAKGPRRQRLTALIPLGLVCLAWAVAYRALGYGSSGSGMYLDPAADPVGYLATAGPRLAALFGALTLGVPSDFWLSPSNRPVLVAAGVAGLAVAAWLSLRVWRGPDAVKWLAVGSLLGLLPAAATFPSDRLLLLPSVGAAAVAASFLATLWTDRTGVARKAALVLLVATHIVFPVAVWLLNPMTLSKMARSVERAALEPGLTDEQLSRRLIAIAAPDFAQTLYPGLVRVREGRPLPESFNVLSYAPYPHRLTRISERSFEVEVVGGAMLGSLYEQMLRADRFPLRSGDRVRLWHAVVTVLDSDGTGVRRLRLDLEDPPQAWQFVQWDDGRIVPLDLPAVGASVLLARHKGAFDQ